jgi:hypothetical protein
MEMGQLVRRVVKGGTEYVIVRPGITLCMLYSTPASELAPAVADILDAYIRFIPSGALGTYLSADGSWKSAPKRVIDKTLKELRATGPGDYAECHLGQEPPRNVGDYGVHFYASPLDDESSPLEDGILYLEFPPALSDFTTPDAFVEFVRTAADTHEFDSGYCGYAFKHLHESFVDESFDAIGKMAMRYVGFDISADVVRLDARARVCNVSWLTLLGPAITEQLGDLERLRKALPDVATISPLALGVMIRATELPTVGDVNRGANDVGALRAVSELTRELRVDAPNLGPDDEDFAERWLGRFDA